MILSILYLLFYAVAGVEIGRYLFSTESFPRRLWLGLTVGLFGNIWLPSLFAFLLGFGQTSHILGAALMGVLTVLCLLQKKKAPMAATKELRSLLPLLWLLPLFFVGAHLFSTHILEPKVDGWYVGQTTYGDLAMHLGFISSLAEQGVFPPEYSIFPGHAVNYPFLCEVPSASLFQFGASLRWAYLLPALYAYALVILGVYFAFQTWLKRTDRARFATYLFFVGGGFGFLYFFDRLNGASTVGALIGENGYANNLSYLLNDFYVTPTNLPRIGLRWVNPIVDMLIPQRATLFGWAFLFPCLHLLLRFAFERRREALMPLILLAGGLPLIHTHSFLALGIVSAVYCMQDLVLQYDKKRLLQWICYGGIVVLLGAPQLFRFAFQQASESSMVRLHFNWANEVDSFLWFYIKNLGWLFILLPFALLLLSKKDRQIALGFLVLWLVSEVVVFQPNIYDNNKLLFAWFFCLCALTAKLLGILRHRFDHRFSGSAQARRSALSLLGMVAALLGFAVYLTAFTHIHDSAVDLPVIGIYTELFLLAFLIYLSIRMYEMHASREWDAWAGFLFLLSSGVALYLLIRLIKESSARSLSVPLPFVLLMGFIGLGIVLIFASLYLSTREEYSKNRGVYACKALLSFLLGCSLFLSGPMTILREWRSSYMMFTNADILAADYIRENTDAHGVFLTDYSWHLNTVSVMTGRSIVCGPDLFLYYHGIDTSERKADVTAMLEKPGENQALFEKYGVRYVYIGSSERSKYNVDTAYFRANGTVLYDQDGIQVFELKQQS
ncbi:MAG: hypothetical protein IJH54_01495 [Clostridia bacterium]|nr:hypothetical protein [Clostridia bacterium]